MTEERAYDLLPVEISDELSAMLDRFPLPQGVPDADMNMAEIAAGLDVTVNTLGKWVGDETFPVVQRGGQGRAYVFRFSHCWAWRQAQIDEEDRRRAHNRQAIDALQASFLGLETDDPAAQLTAKQRQQLAEADFAYNKARQLRRQLVRLTDLVEMLDSVFGIIRNGLEALPDRLERELSLKPEEVRVVIRAKNDTLAKMVELIEKAELEEREISDVAPQDHMLI